MEVLGYVLAVGNYLNAGTAKGNAYGFQLKYLPKVSLRENSFLFIHILSIVNRFSWSRKNIITGFYCGANSCKETRSVTHAIKFGISCQIF